jgi:ComF family protein
MRMFDLPTLCAVCHGWSAQRLCDECRLRHGAPCARCRGCAQRVPAGVARCGGCIAQPLPFDQAIAAVDYAFPWSGFVAALKFHAALDLAGPMARLLADAVRTGTAEPLPDLVLPVPLGARRLAERGMNQAWELAHRVASTLGRPARAGLLERRLDTPHLADLPRDERAREIRGAFALAPGASAALHGRRVALVDDVVTTGATAAEAARVLLRDGGAAAVSLWAFARTP